MNEWIEWMNWMNERMNEWKNAKKQKKGSSKREKRYSVFGFNFETLGDTHTDILHNTTQWSPLFQLLQSVLINSKDKIISFCCQRKVVERSSRPGFWLREGKALIATAKWASFYPTHRHSFCRRKKAVVHKPILEKNNAAARRRGRKIGFGCLSTMPSKV